MDDMPILKSHFSKPEFPKTSGVCEQMSHTRRDASLPAMSEELLAQSLVLSSMSMTRLMANTCNLRAFLLMANTYIICPFLTDFPNSEWLSSQVWPVWRRLHVPG